MTTDYKILGQAELGELALDNSTVKEQVVYEVPANTQFTNSSTSITNTGDSAETYSISVVSNEEKSTAVTDIDYQTSSIDVKYVRVDNLTSEANIPAGYSIDGITWTDNAIPGESWYSVAFGNNIFVAVGHSNVTIDVAAHSTDGINWTRSPMSSYGRWYYLSFLDGQFIASNDYDVYSYSTDGITWTEGPAPTSPNYERIQNFSAYGEIINISNLQEQVPQSLNKHQIIYNKEILAGETHTISGGLTLNSGDQIRAKSTSSDIIVNVYGAELS